MTNKEIADKINLAMLPDVEISPSAFRDVLIECGMKYTGITAYIIRQCSTCFEERQVGNNNKRIRRVRPVTAEVIKKTYELKSVHRTKAVKLEEKELLEDQRAIARLKKRGYLVFKQLQTLCHFLVNIFVERIATRFVRIVWFYLCYKE